MQGLETKYNSLKNALDEFIAFKLCRVPLLRLLFPKHCAIGRWVLASDWGRRYGWFMERDGKAIAELDYVEWDDYSQFWWRYKIRWLSKEYQGLEGRPDELLKLKPTLRSRRFPDVVVNEVLTAGKEPGLICIRMKFVPFWRFFEDKVGPT